MTRIPESDIERLKKEVPLERLVIGFGVELERHGVELIGRCPFHDDKTPSLFGRGVACCVLDLDRGAAGVGRQRSLADGKHEL